MQYLGHTATNHHHKHLVLPPPTTTFFARQGGGADSPHIVISSTASIPTATVTPISSTAISPSSSSKKRLYDGNLTSIINNSPASMMMMMASNNNNNKNKRQKFDTPSTSASPTQFFMRQMMEESMFQRRRAAIELELLLSDGIGGGGGNNTDKIPSPFTTTKINITASTSNNATRQASSRTTSSSMSSAAEAILKAHNLMMMEQQKRRTQHLINSLLMAGGTVASGGNSRGVSSYHDLNHPQKVVAPSIATPSTVPSLLGVLGGGRTSTWEQKPTTPPKSLIELVRPITDQKLLSRTTSAAVVDATLAELESSTGVPSPTLSPNCLYNDGDDRCLSQFQCLARKQIELFEATPEDVSAGARGRNVPIKLGQVGIRCIHCAKHEDGINPMLRKRAAVYFPTKLERVYQTAINMATLHLCVSCEHVPPSIRTTLLQLKDQKSTSGGGKRFVAIGVKKQGVIEVDGGLRFEQHSSATSTTTSVSESCSDDEQATTKPPQR